MRNAYYVYIMASHTKALYAGVTNNLESRVEQHRTATARAFTGRYNVHRLVYYEDYSDINAAIAREKQIKGRLRRKKLALIESTNPRRVDLSFQWRRDGRAESSGDSSLRSE
jgi:putative endonuclease